jgi:hypothetical protein
MTLLCIRYLFIAFLLIFLLSILYTPATGNRDKSGTDKNIVASNPGQVLSHKIETKQSVLLCGEFLLPRAVFSIASRLGHVSRGSCASKGFNAYETATTLNMGVIGTVHVSVYKRKVFEDEKNEFKNPFSQFGYHMSQISHKR